MSQSPGLFLHPPSMSCPSRHTSCCQAGLHHPSPPSGVRGGGGGGALGLALPLAPSLSFLTCKMSPTCREPQEVAASRVLNQVVSFIEGSRTLP